MDASDRCGDNGCDVAWLARRWAACRVRRRDGTIRKAEERATRGRRKRKEAEEVRKSEERSGKAPGGRAARRAAS
ncbi:hypothetical protein EXY72_31230 [Burkholderia pseudomallei]|nr:hypothetical protein EXY72_31230 [Burkholderia pseudomallei]